MQPSRIESFGLTITEALVLGKPVISTKTDGGTELISDRENGLLCDISSESIAAQVKLLIDNPQLRKQLADNAAAIDFEMRNNDVMIEANFRDYAEPKATYTKEELWNIIRRIRADVEQTRNQLAIA